jgi:hypothetical protein
MSPLTLRFSDRRETALDFDLSFFRSEIIGEYHLDMTAKLSKELADALLATGESELELVDPDTQQTYFLVEGEMHRRATEALRRQQDQHAIAQGLAQMEAGQGKPLDQAFSELRSRLGFQPAK